jgi:hypothetical protein
MPSGVFQPNALTSPLGADWLACLVQAAISTEAALGQGLPGTDADCALSFDAIKNPLLFLVCAYGAMTQCHYFVIFLDFIIFVYRIEYIIMHSKLYLLMKSSRNYTQYARFIESKQ